MSSIPQTDAHAVELVQLRGEPRVDSRLLAVELRNQHKNVLGMVERYDDKFKRFGKVAFQTEPLPSGQTARFALLNEDQTYFLLSLSRNTDHVVDLKANLVQSFKQARAGIAANEVEYLPGYHELHMTAHQLAAGSDNERFVHMNLNKLVNKTVGIGPRQRQTAAVGTKSAIVVAQAIAARAMNAANDHHDGYEAAKRALGKLEQALIGGAN